MPQPVVIDDSKTLESGFRAAHNDTARAVPTAGYFDSVTKRMYYTNLETDELFYIDCAALAILDEVPPSGVGTGENPNSSATTESEGVVFLADDDNPNDLESESKVPSMAIISRLLDQYIQSVASPGLDRVISNDPYSEQTPTLGGLKLTHLDSVENPECVAILEKDLDGLWCLKATAIEDFNTSPTKPTVPAVSDQTYIAGEFFTVQFPAFGGAKRHVFTDPPTGFIKDEPNRVISGISEKIGQTIVTYTGINDGVEESVNILFTGIPKPVPQQITNVYWADNGSGASMSLYGFGNAEPQQMLFQVLDPADDSVILSERPFTYDPGKYDRPGLFTGFAPYTALILGLSTGETYRFKARITGSDNYIIEDFTYTSGQKGKIYPATDNVLQFKPVTASTNDEDAPLSNDDDDDTYYESTATAQNAIQWDLLANHQLTSIPLDVDDGTVNFWVIGYPASVTPPAVSESLFTATNWPGWTFLKSFAGPFGSGLHTIDATDGLTDQLIRYLRIQKADSDILKIQAEAHGSPVANTPPNLVSAIPNQVVTEGDPWTFDIRQYFADANLDLLAYSNKILDGSGNPTVDNYDWSPFVSGVYNSPAVEFEGASGTSHVTTFRNYASDGQAQVSGDFTLTVNKRSGIPAGLVRAAIQFDGGNNNLSGFLQLTSGTATLEITGITAPYPAGSPAKGMSNGPFTVGGLSYQLRGVGFPGAVRGNTYRARFNTPNGPYEKQFTVPTGTGNPVIPLYPDSSSGSGASITTLFWDAVRLAAEKKATLRSDASEVVQFQLRKTDGTIIFNFTDGAIPSGKTYYEYISPLVLADGGYIATSRIKSDPSITRSDGFTVSTAAPQIIKIGIAPNSIINGISRSVIVYAQMSTGNIESAWYRFPGDFYQMGTGTYPQDYNRSTGSIGGNEASGINFDTPREFQFRVQGTADVITISYARNGDAVGVIRQVWPARAADAPVQSLTAFSEPGTMDYRVRHVGGKALWRLVINKDSGFNVVAFDSSDNIYINDTTEHTVEIGEDIYLFAFHTRSDDGLDLELQENGEPDPYGSWITRRPFTVVRTSSQRLDP